MTRSAALASLFLWGCLDVAEERAKRDLEIGKAKAGAVGVEVVDGLAAVRGAADGELVLWVSAPAIRLRLVPAAGASPSLRVTVFNVLPDVELRAVSGARGVGAAEPVEGEPATRKRWRVELEPGNTAELVLAPRDADSIGFWRFAVLSDIQEAIDGLQDIHRRINADPSIRFLLGAGDLTERGDVDEVERYQNELRGLNVPYYTTLGNHELGENPTLFHDYFGRGNFHFGFRGVRFTLLDSASATIDPMVYDWLEGWLAGARDRVHLVAMHIPPLDPIGVRGGGFASRNEAAKLLTRLANGKVDMTLYGHIHSYYGFENAGIPAHISGGGGAIPERFDNVGRHFLVVDVSAQGGVSSVQVVEID
jgi:3',5'-cyclic-AMP phosphodiesterase